MTRSIRGIAGGVLAVLATGLLAAGCGGKEGETTPERTGGGIL